MLLDRCYLKPPSNVFERMVGLYKLGDPLNTVEQLADQSLFMVAKSPASIVTSTNTVTAFGD